MTTTIQFISTPTDSSFFQAPTSWAETANKITQFFTRLEGGITLFFALAGAVIASLWSIQCGLIVGAIGLTAAIAIAIFRSGETTPQLSVTIDTERLHIRSIESTPSDHDNYAALFGDAATVEKYATGQTKTREEIVNRIDNSWVKRWQTQDPYAGMAVFNKETGEFIGHVVLGHGDRPGESEFAICLKKEHWGKRYGTEALTALIHEFAPATIQQGYLLEGKPLERIVGTGRPDNIAGCKIAENLGMQLTHQEEKHGALRNHYAIHLGALQSRMSAKITTVTI